MEPATKTQLTELQAIITKLPLQVCSVTVLPELGVRWKDVSRAVRNHRLPMVSSSVARVLCQHVAKSLTAEEVAHVIGRLRVKMLAVQDRKWHVITLLEPADEDITMEQRIHSIPASITRRLGAKVRSGMRPEVQSALLGELLYLSVRMVSSTRDCTPLHLATPPGLPVALVSSTSSSLLKPCVQGLGYSSFEDAHLSGHDIPSLLAIHNRHADENPDHLTEIPQYTPAPQYTANGIDFTYKNYDEKYVDMILGPKPPLLTQLDITSTQPFFDPSRLKKKIKVTVQLKSEDVAKTLKNWVLKGALAPTSDFFHIFNKVKCNRFEYGEE